MLKITDMLAAMVEGQARAAEWEAKFQAEFFGPLLMAQQVQAFLALPPEERAQMPPEVIAQMTGHARRMSQMVNPAAAAPPPRPPAFNSNTAAPAAPTPPPPFNSNTGGNY